jgi:galactokinase
MNPRSEPVPHAADLTVVTLRDRIRAELSADFRADRPLTIRRAPGRLDVMGGIADYTGSLVCEMPLDRSAAVAIQSRDDREIQVFSFNLCDEHLPFTFRMPLDALANTSADVLRNEFAHPGRKFAAYLVGCLFLLHEQGLIDLRDSQHKGINLALHSTVPMGAGVSSSAAIEVAAMAALCDHYRLAVRDGLQLASLCQQVENRIVGAPCGIMDQVTTCLGKSSQLLVMLCQPHELKPFLLIPPGMRFIGINSNVKHSVSGGSYVRTRCAAFMGQKMILAKMAELGQAAGLTLSDDPMRGYLANLDPTDFKRYFRQYLPESMTGHEFLAMFGATTDTATAVDPQTDYHVQGATDHHVMEASRVRNFIKFIEEANTLPAGSDERGLLLDKAGHLMYASHMSYTNDAQLGADECDLLVDLVRQREKKGLYGAKITGGGSGGTVAVLCEQTPKADAAIVEIMAEYQKRTGLTPQAFLGTSNGAWYD